MTDRSDRTGRRLAPRARRLAEADGLVTSLGDAVDRVGAGGSDARSAARTLRDDDILYRVLVGYTSFGTCAHSHAVRANGLVLLAGQGPFRADGSRVEGSFEEQARQTFENVRALAEAGGCTLADVVPDGAEVASSVPVRSDR